MLYQKLLRKETRRIQPPHKYQDSEGQPPHTHKVIIHRFTSPESHRRPDTYMRQMRRWIEGGDFDGGNPMEAAGLQQYPTQRRLASGQLSNGRYIVHGHHLVHDFRTHFYAPPRYNFEHPHIFSPMSTTQTAQCQNYTHIHSVFPWTKSCPGETPNFPLADPPRAEISRHWASLFCV